jgi:hypothetical protein
MHIGIAVFCDRNVWKEMSKRSRLTLYDKIPS